MIKAHNRDNYDYNIELIVRNPELRKIYAAKLSQVKLSVFIVYGHNTK